MITPSRVRLGLFLFCYLALLHIAIGSQAQMATVSGRIKNLSSKEIVLTYPIDELITNSDTLHTIDTDSFFVSFKTFKSAFYLTLRCNRKTLNLFIAPGYQLILSADANQLRESVIFSGNGWPASHYLQAVFQNEAVRKYSWRSDEQDLSNELFFKKCETHRFIKDSIMQKLGRDHGSSDRYWNEFVTSERINDRYIEAAGLLNFSFQKNRTTESRKAFYEKYVVPLELVNGNIESYLFLNSVKNYYSLAFFQYYQFDQDSSHKLVSLEQDGIYGSFFKMALKYYRGKTQKVAAGTILTTLLSLLESQSLSAYPGRYPRVDSLINQYVKISDNKEFVQQLHDRYAKVEQLTAFIPKEYLTGLVLQDQQGLEVRLSEFKGKRVYIDFWASWCAPCIEKFAPLKEMKPLFDSSDLVLVLINLDNDKQTWTTAVQKLSPPGLNYYAAGGMDGKLARFFNIRSIPRYLILNEAGDCVNQYAPDPNDKFLFEKLH